MKKIVKFKKTEIVSEVECEIELPAYFTYGTNKPSDYSERGYFVILCITNPDERAIRISANNHNSGDCNVDLRFLLVETRWSNEEIISSRDFHQVDKLEWDIALELLTESIKTLGHAPEYFDHDDKAPIEVEFSHEQP